MLERIKQARETSAVTVIDVGAQKTVGQDDIYTPLCRASDRSCVIGFEPQAGKAESRDSGSMTMLPYAIGDGGTHTLFINNNDETTSLFPLNRAFCEDFDILRPLQTVAKVQIETKTLDSALSDFGGMIDFLKLDIQGAELMALQGATKTLQRTAVVHCEVEFAPIYDRQPLFPAIAALLEAAGFDFIDFHAPMRFPYRGTSKGEDRLIWSDAIFFRRTEERDCLISQALTAITVYGKSSLAEYLISKTR